jgi:hypothetical protein
MNVVPGGGPPPWPDSISSRLLIWAKTLWWALADGARVFWACRAPLLAVAIGGGLIALTDQARDIVIATADPASGSARHGGNTFFVAVWAISSWYWARSTLNLAFAVDAVDAYSGLWAKLTACERTFRVGWRTFVVNQAPRVIGATAIASLGIAFGKAADIYAAAGDSVHAQTFSDSSWWYAGMALLFYVVVAVRLPATQTLFGGKDGLRAHLVAGRAQFTDLRDYFGNAVTATYFVVSLALSPLLTWRFAVDPVGTSDALGGAVNAVLLGLATLVPVFSVLALVAKRTGLPLFAGVMLWIAIAPWLFSDNHDVRTLAGTAAAPAARPKLDDVFVQWWEVNRKITQPVAAGVGADGKEPVVAPPFIVVATAGGASRAAFWTSQVLGEIARREEGFSDRLFMISGVSGGSLGATVFRSIVDADRRASGRMDVPTMAKASEQAAAFIERDFLGPAMASGLYVDLPFRAAWLLPRSLLPDDRAAALEKAWEAAWLDSIGKDAKAGFKWSDGFIATFSGLGQGKDYRPWPILALNGTSVERGKRILTSNVNFTDSGLSGEINRYDAFKILGADMRISTAVTMSARFPVISPSGGLRDGSDVAVMRVTDGGLFENFGAATIDEVLRYIVERRPERSTDPRPVVPIAILISSDPSLDYLDRITGTGYRPSVPSGQQPTPDCAPLSSEPRRLPAPMAHPGNGWPECPTAPNTSATLFVDPALALYDGRVARGELAATTMLNRISENRTDVADRIASLLAPGTNLSASADPTQSGIPPASEQAAREKIRRDVAAHLGLGPQQHIDFFHFRQCRLPGRKGPTMSWHDSTEAWSAMRAMTGLEGDGDPCGNAAEFFRLCVRLAVLTGKAANDEIATGDCAQPGRWRRPADWVCAQKGDRYYCNLRRRVDRWVTADD